MKENLKTHIREACGHCRRPRKRGFRSAENDGAPILNAVALIYASNLVFESHLGTSCRQGFFDLATALYPLLSTALRISTRNLILGTLILIFGRRISFCHSSARPATLPPAPHPPFSHSLSSESIGRARTFRGAMAAGARNVRKRSNRQSKWPGPPPVLEAQHGCLWNPLQFSRHSTVALEK